jgi:hypothetical protein
VTGRVFFESWKFLVCVALLSAIPLLWPETPPLVDLPGHIGRYHVQLDGGASPDLSEYFSFHWALIANLGVDLLIIPIASLIGLEPGVKLIVLLIPPLTVFGIFWTAREVHGRVPPTTLFAVPFAYGFPFNYGFVNFALSMAFALNAFAFWLRLKRSSTNIFRSAIFVPISCLVWTSHALGWGVLGLMVWSSEFIGARDQGQNWLRAAVSAARASIPLALPLLPMIAWRAATTGATSAGFFRLGWKTYYLAASMGDRWLLLDTFSVAVIVVLIGAAIFDRQLELSRRLAIPAAVLFVVFLILPIKMFGSAYTDARLAPFIFILAVAAIRLSSETSEGTRRRLALLACSFIGVRLIANTASFAMADAEWKTELQALNHIPKGARVLSLVGLPCRQIWSLPRHAHLGSFVIFRKDGFSNDQWEIPGAQLLDVRYASAEPFVVDPSEVTYSQWCVANVEELEEGQSRPQTADQALEELPRAGFDFVWLLKPAGFTVRPIPGLTLVWSDTDSRLYRVTR